MTLLACRVEFRAKAGKLVFVLLANLAVLCLEVIKGLMYFLKFINLCCD